MLGDEARVLLGFPVNSTPTPSQIKAAYRKKVWESHPDLFPVHEKHCAESRFKSISEAYTYLLSVAQAYLREAVNGFEEKPQIESWGDMQREIPCTEMEEFYGDEIDENNHEGKRLSETVSLDALVESVEFNIAAGGVTTDDDSLDFISGARGGDSASATYSRVVRTGTPRAHGGRSNRILIRIPFLFIVLGTVGLGGLNASRAYKKQKEAYPSHNPFLP